MPESNEPERSHRPLQFGLGLLLLVVTAAALLFAFPRFFFGVLALLLTVLLALVVFAVVFYAPVAAGAKMLGRSQHRKHDEQLSSQDVIKKKE